MPVTRFILRGKETQEYFDKLDGARKGIAGAVERMIQETAKNGRRGIAHQIHALLNEIGLYSRMVEHEAHGDEDAQTAEEGSARLDIHRKRGHGHQCTDKEIQAMVIERARAGRSLASFTERFGNEPPFGA
jgi:hypothetical protein